MPVPWRLHVLEESLRQGVEGPFLVESVDLMTLPPLEQSAALDALIETGSDFPVTLVNGVPACFGDIEVDRIVEAARRATKE